MSELTKRATQRNINRQRLLTVKGQLLEILVAKQQGAKDLRGSLGIEVFALEIEYLESIIATIVEVIKTDYPDEILSCVRCIVESKESPALCLMDDTLFGGEETQTYGCDHQHFVPLKEWNKYCIDEMKRTGVITGGQDD